MTVCERYEQQISALLDGELPEAEQSELQAHLRTCASCAATWRMFSEISTAMHELEAEPPADLSDRILSQLAAEDTPVVPIDNARPKKRGWKTFAAMAACLAVIVGVAVFAGPSRISQSVPARITPAHQTAAPERTIPDQTEDAVSPMTGSPLGSDQVAALPELESQKVLALLAEPEPVEAEAPAEEAEPACVAVEVNETGEEETTTLWIDGEDVVYTADGEHFFRAENTAESVQLLLVQGADGGN